MDNYYLNHFQKNILDFDEIEEFYTYILNLVDDANKNYLKELDFDKNKIYVFIGDKLNRIIKTIIERFIYFLSINKYEKEEIIKISKFIDLKLLHLGSIYSGISTIYDDHHQLTNFPEIKKLVQNNPITKVESTNETIKIFLEKGNKILILNAIADCCSKSWFEILDKPLDFLLNKIIIEIKPNGNIEMEQSGEQEHDINKLVYIYLENNEKFEFVLRNSSNGYYNGWLEFSLEDV